MKLMRLGPKGHEVPAILDQSGVRRDVSSLVADWTGAMLDDDSLAAVRQANHTTFPVLDDDLRIGPCVGDVGKILCIGLNYSEHVAETGAETPTDPVLFMKATSAICGPNDDIEIPPGSQKTDWEVELAAVIGKTCKHVDKADALDHVAGYCATNDVSERAYQLDGLGQWVKGKSYDTFGPIGPYLATRDDVPDPQSLDLWLTVDGKSMQNGNTSKMIFDVAELISFSSRYMTLQPGDVIMTGTPHGVGLSMKPPVYLSPGSVIELGIDGLGQQRHICRSG